MNFLTKLDRCFFSIMGPNQFIFTAVFFSIIGDGTYLVFLKFVLGSEKNLKIWMQNYAWMPNMDIILSNADLASQMTRSFNSMLNILIGLVIFTNLIGYFFFIKQKKFAISYIKNLALTGALLGIFAVWEAKEHGLLWVVLIGISIPLYYFIYRGIHFHNKKN